MHRGRLDDGAGLELVLLSKLGVILGAGGVEGGVVGGLHAGKDEEDDGNNDKDPAMTS